MNKTTAAIGSIALAASILIAPSAGASTATVAVAAKSDYSKKKQDRFWRVVSRYEPMVKIAGKKSTVDLGIATCDLLRAGGDLYDLTYLLLDADAGVAEDSIMAIMAAAPIVLCPDQQYKFD
jgi:hypothetical protein